VTNVFIKFHDFLLSEIMRFYKTGLAVILWLVILMIKGLSHFQRWNVNIVTTSMSPLWRYTFKNVTFSQQKWIIYFDEGLESGQPFVKHVSFINKIL